MNITQNAFIERICAVIGDKKVEAVIDRLYVTQPDVFRHHMKSYGALRVTKSRSHPLVIMISRGRRFGDAVIVGLKHVSLYEAREMSIQIPRDDMTVVVIENLDRGDKVKIAIPRTYMIGGPMNMIEGGEHFVIYEDTLLNNSVPSI